MKFPFVHKYLRQRSLPLFAVVLLLLSFISSWYFQSEPSITYQQRLLQRYITSQQKDASQLIGDTALLGRLATDSETLEEFTRVSGKKYSFFLAQMPSHQLIFWNTQKIHLPKAESIVPNGVSLQRLSNGSFFVEKHLLNIRGKTLAAYVVLPVLYQYFLESKYFPTRFAHEAGALKQIELATKPTDHPILSLQGTPVFYINRLSNDGAAQTDLVTLVLRMSALLLLLAYIQWAADGVRRNRGKIRGLLFLTACVVLVRLLLLFFPDLLSLRQFNLFDPAVYASDDLNRSLGDLLINAGLLCWLVLYAWQTLRSVKHLPPFIKGRAITASGWLLVLLLVLSTFHLATIVFGLVKDSTISFRVTDFFSLNTYTIYGFVVLALLSLTYYYLSQMLFRFTLAAIPNLLHIYSSVAVLGLLFLTIMPAGAGVLFFLRVLVWLILYTLVLSNEDFIINRSRINIAGVLFWIFVFSISMAVLVLQANKGKEENYQRSLADKYFQTTNPNSEKLLRIALSFLDPPYLKANFQRFYQPAENRRLRDSIIGVNFRGYSAQFTTELYVFDAKSRPVNNDAATPFSELNTVFTIQSKPTATEFVRYYETSYDQYTYITKRIIADSTGFTGTFFILSTPKQFQSTDAFDVELFRQPNSASIERSVAYDYALYTRGVLRNHTSGFPFSINLSVNQVQTSETGRTTENGFDVFWYRPNNQNLVMVVKKQNTFIESITIFSYLFCAFLFMVALLQGIGLLVQWSKNRSAISLFQNLTIRNQIHGTVIFISVASFLVIGTATITFFINRYQRNNEERLSRTAAVTIQEMQKGAGDAALFANGFSFTDSTSFEAQKKLIREIAEVHDVEVNIYDILGNLQITSLEELYDYGILSRKIDPLAFYHLKNLKEVQRVQDEKLSTLEYLNIYSAVRDTTGRTYAYLNIPYFSSQFGLKQEISNFFVTIVNLNAFIFLIAGIVALFIANRITRSFSVIGDKMKQITLGKTADEIVWTKKDEIGELVKQYNKMVNQLELSAEALAKSEREGAWREMARQVAHEIKNPLTPMKLSIQYLQKANQNNLPNVQQLTTSVANTLIEQIDHLSKIAADFSQFANIGNKRIEKVDLHNILRSLVDLYASNPKVKIEWNHVPNALNLLTDRTHMNRLFTNLFANAVDACADGQQCHLTIDEEMDGRHVIIAVRDNGTGIPEEMQSKIFTPNFTTKTSGTGLGLAMCKSISEQAGGAIWFETEDGKGTSFYVQLPLAKNEI